MDFLDSKNIWRTLPWTWYPGTLAITRGTSRLSPPLRGWREVYDMFRDFLLSQNCFTSFINEGAHIFFGTATSSSHYKSGTARHISAFKVQLLALTSEGLPFFTSLFCLAMEQKTVKVFLLYMSDRSADFPVQVLCESLIAMIEAACLGA